MRIVMDLGELSEILTQYFGTTVLRENLMIDPASESISISDAPLNILSKPTQKAQKPAPAPQAAAATNQYTEDDTESDDVELSDELAMEALAQINLTAAQSKEILQNPEIQRFLGEHATTERPY